MAATSSGEEQRAFHAVILSSASVHRRGCQVALTRRRFMGYLPDLRISS